MMKSVSATYRNSLHDRTVTLEQNQCSCSVESAANNGVDKQPDNGTKLEAVNAIFRLYALYVPDSYLLAVSMGMFRGGRIYK